jgi:CheY-like chemotaxis protein
VTRVLVIDDDEGVRFVLQRILEHDGFDVETAEDGEQGVIAARERLPQIIILDLMMPHVDGFQALEQLAEDERTVSIPVIVLTARAESSMRDRCMEAGAEVVMTKPFEPTSLAEQIARILAARPASV